MASCCIASIAVLRPGVWQRRSLVDRLILNSEWEAVPFYRYTYENLQMSGFAGTDLNAPTGAGQLQFHNVGVAVFPSPKVVLKATYQKVINKDPAGAKSDSILGGVGFFF